MELIDYVGVALTVFMIVGFAWGIWDIFVNRLK